MQEMERGLAVERECLKAEGEECACEAAEARRQQFQLKIKNDGGCRSI